MNAQDAAPYEQAFGVQAGELARWARGRIDRAISRANAVLAGCGEKWAIALCSTGDVERLHEMGLDTRIVEADPLPPLPATAPGAFTESPEYRAWWASVMTPPFEGDKGPEHRRLADAAHAAWEAETAAAPVAREAGTGTEE